MSHHVEIAHIEKANPAKSFMFKKDAVIELAAKHEYDRKIISEHLTNMALKSTTSLTTNIDDQECLLASVAKLGDDLFLVIETHVRDEDESFVESADVEIDPVKAAVEAALLADDEAAYAAATEVDVDDADDYYFGRIE